MIATVAALPNVLIPRASLRWLACARAVASYRGVVQLSYDYDKLLLAAHGDAGFSADIRDAWEAGVLLFTRCFNRTQFWRDVAARTTVVWEGTARSLTGIVLRPPGERMGALPVYDFAHLQQAQYVSVDCSDNPTPAQLQERTLAFLQQNLLQWADPATAPVFEFAYFED